MRILMQVTHLGVVDGKRREAVVHHRGEVVSLSACVHLNIEA